MANTGAGTGGCVGSVTKQLKSITPSSFLALYPTDSPQCGSTPLRTGPDSNCFQSDPLITSLRAAGLASKSLQLQLNSTALQLLYILIDYFVIDLWLAVVQFFKLFVSKRIRKRTA